MIKKMLFGLGLMAAIGLGGCKGSPDEYLGGEDSQKTEVAQEYVVEQSPLKDCNFGTSVEARTREVKCRENQVAYLENKMKCTAESIECLDDALNAENGPSRETCKAREHLCMSKVSLDY